MRAEAARPGPGEGRASEAGAGFSDRAIQPRMGGLDPEGDLRAWAVSRTKAAMATDVGWGGSCSLQGNAQSHFADPRTEEAFFQPECNCTSLQH